MTADASASVSAGTALRRIARTADHPQRRLDVVARLDRMAVETPQAAAILLPDRRVTYAALAARSRAVAARLSGGSDTPVLVLSDFDPGYVAAQIACLRVRRPFVPIDPTISPLRFAQIALQCGADIVICGDGASPATVALLPQLQTLSLDALGADGPPIDRSAEVDSDAQTSFIVFTSGSTGVAKGVPHTNAFLASFLTMNVHDLDMRRGDRFAVATPPGVIAGPIFAPHAIFADAQLLMASDRLDASATIEMLARERATHFACYAGLARALAGHPAARAAFADLRMVQMFGDVVGAADCARIHDVLPPTARIRLNYGCTESMPMATWVPPRGVAGDGDRIPLGAPAPGMELWLRPDEGAASAAPQGELLTAGPRVTRGYWRDDAATRGRLVPHPEDPGRTLFAIGDIVRLRPDGMLDFLGRADNQIKLRGWRIELEEIEIAARRVPGVTQAAAVPRRRATGLVDALALHVVGPAAPAAVLTALRQTLPEHMVPATAVAIASLPLTATGKVDRVRLAEIDRQIQDAASPASCIASDWPDAISARIATIFAEECGRTAIAPSEYINNVGFDSLQAVSIALRIEKQFAISIEPDLLLAKRTLASIVAEIAARGVAAQDIVAADAAVDFDGAAAGPSAAAGDPTDLLVARLLRDRVVVRAWPLADEEESDALRRFRRLAADGNWTAAFRAASDGLAPPSGDVALRRAAFSAALSAASDAEVRAGLDAFVANGAADPAACAIHLVACTTGAQTFDARRASSLSWANALMWAVDKVDPGLLARMVAPLLPLIGNWAMFGDLVAIMDRMPAARADDPFLDHTHAALQLAPVPSGRSSALLIGFCGGGGRIGLPINMFHRWAGASGAHVLYLRAERRGGYDDGIPESGPGYDTLAGFVRALAGALGVAQVGIYGNSSGAFPAAKLGLRLDARRIVIAAGATHLEADSATVPVAPPTGAIRDALVRDVAASIARSRGRSEILCIHAEDNGHDRANAEALAGLPGVRVMPVAGHQHNVARQLALTDMLGPVLAWACGGETLPALAR